MVDVDRQTDEAIEMVSQGARLTTNLINYIFKSLADRLEKGEKDAVINSQSKEGKQKINNLLRKHKDGIQTLDENLTKEQVKDYQKELKKLGVDFSIVKNGKDNYSFFFAGGQAGVIEKALKNVVELKSKVMNNEKVKDAQMDLDSEMNNFSEKEIENVNKAYSKYLSNKEIEEKIPERENLTDKEKVLFDKIKKLDETEKEVQEQIQREESKDSSVEKSTVTFNTKEEQLQSIYSELSKDEIELFKQLNEKNKESLDNHFADPGGSSYTEKKKYESLLESHSDESINKVNDLYYKNIEDTINTSPENKIHMDELNSVEKSMNKKMEQGILTENEQKYLKQQDKKMESKDKATKKLNEKLYELSNEELELFEKRMEYENVATAPSFNASETYRLADELKELQKGHSKETINKINNLDKDFRNPDNFSEVSEGNKLNANEILRQTKKHSSERSNENKKEFSVANVKVIDQKIKEESKDKEKVRKKEQSL